jgi:diguanylate cyclase (GGDEF)-like protein
VFRIGGDEFVVVLKNRDYANRHRIFAEFRQKMEENSRQNLVVVSAGMSDYMENKDLTLQDVFQRADSLMYQDKKQWKGVL